MSDASSSLAVQGYAGERLYLLLRAKGQFRAAGELAQTRIAAEGGSPETEVYLAADDVWAEASAHFDDRTLVHLIGAIGTKVMARWTSVSNASL